MSIGQAEQAKIDAYTAYRAGTRPGRSPGKPTKREEAIAYYSQPVEQNPRGFYYGLNFAIASEGQREVQRINEMAQNQGYNGMADLLSGWDAVAPNAQPGTLLALAQARFTPSVINNPEIRQMLALDADQQNKNNLPAAAQATDPGSAVADQTWFQTGFNHFAWDPIKFVTRNLFESMMSPLQALEAGGANAVGALTKEGGPDWGGVATGIMGINPISAAAFDAGGAYNDQPSPWAQTEIGQSYLAGYHNGFSNIDQGDGIFGYDENSGVGLAQRQATYKAATMRWKGTGTQESWSLGRASASTVFQNQDDLGAKVVSGLIDGIVSLVADPTIFVGKATKTVQAAREIAKMTDLAKAAAPLRTAAEEARAAGVALDTEKAAKLAATERELAFAQQNLSQYDKSALKSGARLQQEREKMNTAGAVAQARRTEVEQNMVDEQGALLLEQRMQAHEKRDIALDNWNEARAQAQRHARRGTGAGAAPKPWVAEMDQVAERLGGYPQTDEALAHAQEVGGSLGRNPGGVVTNDIPAARPRQAVEIGFGTGDPAAIGTQEALHMAPAGKLRVVDAAAPINRNVRGTTTTAAGEVVGKRDTLARDMVDVVGQKGKASATRQEAAAALADLVNDPKATWGDVVSFAADFSITKPVAQVLSKHGIHAVRGVRESLGLEQSVHGPGVWWTEFGPHTTGVLEPNVGQMVGRKAVSVANEDVRAARDAAREATTAAQDTHRAVTMQQRTLLTAYQKAQRAEALYGEKITRHAKAAESALTDAEMRRFYSTNVTDLEAEAERLRAAFGKGYDETWKMKYDTDKVVDGLFGTRTGRALLDSLVAADDVAQVVRMTGGKLPLGLSKAVADAKDVPEVVAAIAPHIGLDVTTQFKSWRGLPGIDAVAAKLPKAPPMAVLQKGSNLLNRLNAIVPNGVVLKFDDPDGTARSLDNYLRYIGLGQEHVDSMYRELAAATDSSSTYRAVTNVMDGVQKSLTDVLAGKTMLSPKARKYLQDHIDEDTRLFQSAREGVNNHYNTIRAHRAENAYMLHDGRRVEAPAMMLDSEFARGGIALPPARELRAVTGKATALLRGHGASRMTLDAIRFLFGTVWRTAMLVMKPAFVIRNNAEEQVRLYLSGHESVFTHPMGMLSMAMSNRGNENLAKAINKMRVWNRNNADALLQRDMHGKLMARPTSDDLDHLDAVNSDYTEALGHMYSFLDSRIYRQGSLNNALPMPLRYGQPDFTYGWARELGLLRQSKLSRLVVGDTKGFEGLEDFTAQHGLDHTEGVLRWLTETPEGGKFVKGIESSSPEVAMLLRDRGAARAYLFEGDGSIQRRIDELTDNNGDLVDYLRTGKLRDSDGAVVHDSTILFRDPDRAGTAIEQRARHMAGTLHPFAETLSPEAKATMAVRSTKRTGLSDVRGLTRTATDWFFDKAASVSKSNSFGPEFRTTYWEEVSKRAFMLDDAAKAEALKVAEQVLPQHARKMPWVKDLMTELRKQDGKGALGIDDIGGIASQIAGKHVQSLFYNSMKEKAYWNSLRLVFPFGQAYADSMATWTRLAAKNPLPVYNYSKLHNAAMSPGSNTMYDVMNFLDPFGDVEYDQNQGFFYKDPTDPTSQMRFHFPLALSAPLAALYGAPAAQLSGSASSLNLMAGGATALPGVGPLGSLAVSTGATDRLGDTGKFLESWSQPFGEPDFDSGVLESMGLPSWTRKMLVQGGFWPGGGDQQRMTLTKSAMAYLASSREPQYNGLTDPKDWENLQNDSDSLARTVAVMLGVGAWILPVSPNSDWYMRNNKDGKLEMLGTVTANYFADKNQSSWAEAGDRLLKDYGPAGLVAIQAMTSKGITMSDEAMNFVRSNPRFSNEAELSGISTLFPGQSSLETLRWEKLHGYRDRLTPSEFSNEVQAALYRLQANQVDRVASANHLTADEKALMKNDLDAKFSGVAPRSKFTSMSPQDRFARLQYVMRDPAVIGLPQAQEAAGVIAMYEDAQKRAQAQYGAGLKSERATAEREALLKNLDAADTQSRYRTAQSGGSDVSGVTDLIRSLMGE